MTIHVGTAPDSWGVWFPSDDRQPPWQQFLDEVVLAGYRTVEIGPYGYLPTDSTRLTRELAARELSVSAGFIMPTLHDRAQWPQLREEVARLCELLTSARAEYMVLIPNVYTDLFTGEQIGPANLSDDDWQGMVEAAHMVAALARDEWGLQVVVHPHAESPLEYEHQIARFLNETDPLLLGLCLDMGHHAYRGGDVVGFIRRYHDRIRYLHVKSVDAVLREKVERENIPFAKAVELGMFVEPRNGVIDFSAVAALLKEIGYAGYAIVEQDMYPTEFDKPLPIARRTRQYLTEIGLG